MIRDPREPVLPEDVPPRDPVTFVGVPEVKPVTSLSLQVAQAEAAAAPIKVRVNKPYRVVHDGKVYLGGQTLTVPNDLIHARWLDAGWVTKVKGSK
jgi:hypothetical protein